MARYSPGTSRAIYSAGKLNQHAISCNLYHASRMLRVGWIDKCFSSALSSASVLLHNRRTGVTNPSSCNPPKIVRELGLRTIN